MESNQQAPANSLDTVQPAGRSGSSGAQGMMIVRALGLAYIVYSAGWLTYFIAMEGGGDMPMPWGLATAGTAAGLALIALFRVGRWFIAANSGDERRYLSWNSSVGGELMRSIFGVGLLYASTMPQILYHYDMYMIGLPVAVVGALLVMNPRAVLIDPGRNRIVITKLLGGKTFSTEEARLNLLETRMMQNGRYVGSNWTPIIEPKPKMMFKLTEERSTVEVAGRLVLSIAQRTGLPMAKKN